LCVCVCVQFFVITSPSSERRGEGGKGGRYSVHNCVRLTKPTQTKPRGARERERERGREGERERVNSILYILHGPMDKEWRGF
jgi:hypothetical protein